MNVFSKIQLGILQPVFIHLEGVMYQIVLLALCGASLVAGEQVKEQGSVAALVREEVVSIESEAILAQDLLVQDLTEEESFVDEEIDAID